MPQIASSPADAPVAAVQEDRNQGLLLLPGGLLLPDGACAKAVYVRPLTGRDEEVLAERRYRNPVEQTTDFLAGVIVRVEGLDRPVDRDLVAGMLVGDRDYLILKLRQMSLGDTVEQVMRCPGRGCGQKVDVDFRISEIEVRRAETVHPRYEVTFSQPALEGDELSYHGFVRLPTGRDQEAVADLVDTNPAMANTRLFSRVLLQVGRVTRLDEEQVRGFPLRVRCELTEFLRHVSPGPNLDIEIQCPHCGADMTYPFDLHRFFFDELVMDLARLYEEVHHLAFHYHWSETEILELPRAKRRRYLALLAEMLDRGSQREATE